MTDVTAQKLPLNSDSSSSSESQTDVTNLAFVNEVRVSRLNILWKATLVGVLFLAWLIILLTNTSENSIFELIVAISVISVGSLATRFFLNRDHYEIATWTYALGLIATISMMVSFVSEPYFAFVGVPVIFVLGMMMSVPNTIILLFVSYVSMVTTPFILQGKFSLSEMELFAYFLMGISALLVIQVSGELYGIAEWALESYRRERSTANALHESRQEIEKSLLKQKNLTLQVQEVNEELDEARRAAEMAKHFRGMFLANMSHELRTPLNAIIGFSDTMLNFAMMYSNVELPGEYRADLTQIHNSGTHLLNIINDILDLSKIDAGRLEIEFTKVELGPLVESVMATAVGLIGGKPVELKRNLPAEMPSVWGDPLRVRQVVTNLYSNAAKFTQEGTITVGVESKADTVVIALEDTGPGIEPDLIENIFEAFQQGKSGKRQQRMGAGLGLAISKELLELMDGSIWVESELDKGSTFYIELPLYQGQDKSEVAEPADSGTTVPVEE